MMLVRHVLLMSTVLFVLLVCNGPVRGEHVEDDTVDTTFKQRFRALAQKLLIMSEIAESLNSTHSVSASTHSPTPSATTPELRSSTSLTVEAGADPLLGTASSTVSISLDSGESRTAAIANYSFTLSGTNHSGTITFSLTNTSSNSLSILNHSHSNTMTSSPSLPLEGNTTSPTLIEDDPWVNITTTATLYNSTTPSLENTTTLMNTTTVPLENASWTRSISCNSGNGTNCSDWYQTAEPEEDFTMTPTPSLAAINDAVYLTDTVLKHVFSVSMPTNFENFLEWPGVGPFSNDVFTLLRNRGFTFLQPQYSLEGIFFMGCLERNNSYETANHSFSLCYDHQCTMEQQSTFVCPVESVLGCRCPDMTGPRYPPLQTPVVNATRKSRDFEFLATDLSRYEDVRLSLEFVIRLENVESYVPLSINDITATYDALYVACLHAFEDPTFVAKYRVDVAGIMLQRLRRVMSTPSPITLAPTLPPPTTPEPSGPLPTTAPPPKEDGPQLLYLLFLLVLLIPFIVAGVRVGVQKVKERRYRKSFNYMVDQYGVEQDPQDGIMMAGLTPSNVHKQQSAAADALAFSGVADAGDVAMLGTYDFDPIGGTEKPQKTVEGFALPVNDNLSDSAAFSDPGKDTNDDGNRGFTATLERIDGATADVIASNDATFKELMQNYHHDEDGQSDAPPTVTDRAPNVEDVADESLR